MQHHSEPKRFWVNYREAVCRSLQRVGPDRFEVRADSTSLQISLDSCRGFRGRRAVWIIPWGEIRTIVAFKADNLAHDAIWITIHTQEVGVDERAGAAFPDTADGWRAALEALPRYLPTCEPFESWFSEVAFPAFSENGRVIYESAAA